MNGRLTSVSRGRGCGFIKAANGQDVFFHGSDLQGANLNELKIGEAVRFTLIADILSGPRATLVHRGKDS